MRRRTKGLIYLAVIVCVLALGTVIVFRTQGERIAIKMGDFLTSRVGLDRNLSLEIGNITGSVIRDLKFEDVLVTYTGGDRPAILLSASAVYARFNLPALLLGRIEIDSLVLESPNMTVPRRSDGSRIYLTGDTKPGPSGKPTAIRIESVAVRDASVNWQGNTPRRISHFNALGSLASTDDGYGIMLQDADLQYGRTLGITGISGSAEMFDNAVRIDSLSLETRRSRFALSGLLGRGGSDSIRLQVTVDSLGLEEVPTFTGGDPRPDLGKLAGLVTVGGTYSSIDFSLALEGDVLGWPVEDLTADLTYGDETADLDRLSAVINGVALDLSCEYAMSEPPRYKGVVAFSDLDLSRFISDQGGAFDSDLNGSIRFSGSGHTAESLRLATWPGFSAGRYRDWRFDAIRGRVDVTSVGVVLDSVRVGLAATEVMTVGRIGYDGKTDLGFTFDIPSLEGVSAYHGQEDLDGSVWGEARLTRGTEGLGLDAEAYASNIDFRGTEIGSLTVDLTLAEAGGRREGEGHLFGHDLDIMGLKGTELIGDFSLEDTTVSIGRLALTRTDGSLLGVVGSLDMRDEGFGLTLSNLFVEMAGFIWENPYEVRVAYEGDSLTVSDFALQSRMGRISVERATYDGRLYSISSTVEAFDLGLLKSVTEKEMPTGLLNVTMTASGTADSLAFDVGFQVAGGEILSVEFESLTGAIGYDGRRVDLAGIELKQNGGRVSVNGWIPADLSPTGVRQVLKSGNGYDLIEDLGEISVEVSDIDVALLQPLIPPVAKIRGFADLTMDIRGNKHSPEVSSRGSLRDAIFGETRIGPVQWEITLADSVLRVSRLAFGEGDESGRISGHLPLAVSILPFSSRLLRESWDLDIAVENGNMGLLCELIPRLKVCSGTYAVDLRVGGNVADPTFDGLVSLSGARLRLEGVAQDIRDLYLELATDGKRFEITRMVAEGGALKASGFFELVRTRIKKWDIVVDLNHYRVTEFEDLYAQLKGRLQIRSERIAPGLSVPMIEGALVVEEGEYYYVATGEGGGGDIIPMTPTPAWVMNITVEIPNDFWIRGSQVTAELQGDLSVRRGRKGLMVLGTLKTIRGDFKLYHNSFRISKGEFRFSDVKSFWNAYIELEANATVLDERIQITANGYIDELYITATSESGWNEQQIFEALLLRRGDVSEAGEEPGFVSQAFVRSWATALANQVSDDVARELHLDRFGVEIGESVEGDALSATRFTFGKYVSDKVYLEYSQSLGSLYGDRRKFTQTGLSYPERQISVEYRLSDTFSIEGETGTIGGLEYFEVDLKLHYGY